MWVEFIGLEAGLRDPMSLTIKQMTRFLSPKYSRIDSQRLVSLGCKGILMGRPLSGGHVEQEFVEIKRSTQGGILPCLSFDGVVPSQSTQPPFDLSECIVPGF